MLPLNWGASGNMSQRGFTLIEMAMVMIVVGLMVGGGLFALAPVIDKARVNQTNATLDQVESALELFVIRNQRLPCPADGAQINTSGTYGVENCGLATEANAVIPWKTMGLDESYSIDGWGTRLSYWPSGTLGIGSSLTAAPDMERTGGTNYPSGTYLTVTDVVSKQTVTSTTSGADRAAYVLVSHGKSQLYGWSKTGKQVLPDNSLNLTNKQCNNNPAGCALGTGTSFASGGPIGPYPPQTNTPTYFDDLVRWRSPAMMIQLCGTGSCGNP